MMKRLIAVLSCAFLVFCTACAGTAESSSVPDEPKVSVEDLFRGVYSVKEEDGVVTPLRFSARRLQDYTNYEHIPYAACTTGVRLDFYTDAPTIGFLFELTDMHYDGDSAHPDDCFDIYENGEYQDSVTVDAVTGGNELSYTRTSTEAESRITIIFPTYHGVTLSKVELGNARPYDEYDHKILFLGDSITQGLFADKVSDNYVDVVCRALNADYMNLAVGGELFRPAALDEDVHYQPDYIVVALGTNDVHQQNTATVINSNCHDYLEKLARIYDGVPVMVLMPFEYQADDFIAAYTNNAQEQGYTVINGYELLDDVAENFSPDGVHPSSKGFAQIAENLLPILQEQLG